MKWTKIAAVLIFFAHAASGQDSTLFKINLPKEFQTTGATVKLKVDNGIWITSIPLNNKFVIFKIPAKDTSSKLRVEYSLVGFQPKNWEGNFKLIGSEKISIALGSEGNLSLRQWPKVEFEFSGSVADIKIDGKVIGSTFCAKTLEPDVDHTIEWVKTGNVHCSKTIRLTFNQKRRYTCNSDKLITED
jgi:hypothetical protein